MRMLLFGCRRCGTAKLFPEGLAEENVTDTRKPDGKIYCNICNIETRHILVKETFETEKNEEFYDIEFPEPRFTRDS